MLAEIERTTNPRARELLDIPVKHLHAFVRETNLTEAEFQHIARIIATLGQLSTESHNEVVLISARSGRRHWSACRTTALGARTRPRT